MRELTPLTIAFWVVAGLVLAVGLYRLRHVAFRGVPTLSATAVGLFRIALGLALLRALTRYLELPDPPAPGGSPDEAQLWTWSWVTSLANDAALRDALLVPTVVAGVTFTLGLFSRLSYAVLLAGLVVRLLVGQEFGQGSHAWVVLPVALTPLLLVRWGDALSLDAWIRRLRGRPSAARPPGPHYGLAVWLPGLALGIAWCAAAFSKLGLSGIEWATGGAVRYHWAEDHLNAPTDWGSWVAGHETLAVLCSTAGLAAEALFVAHVLFRSPWIRLAFGLLGLGLLSGFYLFQGLFWFAWWVLLLPFVPWEPLAGALRRGRRAATPAVASAGRRELLAALSPVVAAVVAFMVVQQLAISRAKAEQMPFFSDYPMYNRTLESPDAFNERVSPVKFYRYEYVALDSDLRRRRIDDRVEGTPIEPALRDAAVWRSRFPDGPLNDDFVDQLTAAEAAYERQYGEDLRLVRVKADARDFDFTGGGVVDSTDPEVVQLDLDGTGGVPTG